MQRCPAQPNAELMIPAAEEVNTAIFGGKGSEGRYCGTSGLFLLIGIIGGIILFFVRIIGR